METKIPVYDDIIFIVMSYLDLKSLFNLFLTCKYYKFLSNEQVVCKQILLNIIPKIKEFCVNGTDYKAILCELKSNRKKFESAKEIFSNYPNHDMFIHHNKHKNYKYCPRKKVGISHEMRECSNIFYRLSRTCNIHITETLLLPENVKKIDMKNMGIKIFQFAKNNENYEYFKVIYEYLQKNRLYIWKNSKFMNDLIFTSIDFFELYLKYCKENMDDLNILYRTTLKKFHHMPNIFFNFGRYPYYITYYDLKNQCKNWKIKLYHIKLILNKMTKLKEKHLSDVKYDNEILYTTFRSGNILIFEYVLNYIRKNEEKKKFEKICIENYELINHKFNNLISIMNKKYENIDINGTNCSIGTIAVFLNQKNGYETLIYQYNKSFYKNAEYQKIIILFEKYMKISHINFEKK
jgi:hypothetical protein